MTKFIFITGGVVSSLGKGLLAASLGALLQARGHKILLRKLDPYLNIDPGTMSPTEHGEVFVTDDGTETDLDLGHYERFTGINSKSSDNITTGKVYNQMLQRERKGKYLGKTVQIIPHITDLIRAFIVNDTDKKDFVICEIGGTVGDIEASPFLETIKQIRYQLGKSRSLFIHLTLLPYVASANELKTKPTQHSVKELGSIGIKPDIIVCRSEKTILKNHIKKISLSCNITPDMIIPAKDSKSIYEVPLSYNKHNLDGKVLEHFAIQNNMQPNMSKWHHIAKTYNNPKHKITVAVVGKYIKLRDAYKSLIEAINHSGIALETKVQIKLINSRLITAKNVNTKLKSVDAVIVPGGFGIDGVEGKIMAIKFSRENKIPFLGICMGAQLAVIEILRNVGKLEDVGSDEFGTYKNPAITFASKWIGQDNQTKTRDAQDDLGGTMRLGSYKCHLSKNSKAIKIYKKNTIDERHRHRFEIDANYETMLNECGAYITGYDISGKLPEIIEISNHPWFIGTQFHPELLSRIFKPHPLFNSLMAAALQQSHSITDSHQS